MPAKQSPSGTGHSLGSHLGQLKANAIVTRARIATQIIANLAILVPFTNTHECLQVTKKAKL